MFNDDFHRFTGHTFEPNGRGHPREIDPSGLELALLNQRLGCSRFPSAVIHHMNGVRVGLPERDRRIRRFFEGQGLNLRSPSW